MSDYFKTQMKEKNSGIDDDDAQIEVKKVASSGVKPKTAQELQKKYDEKVKKRLEDKDKEIENKRHYLVRKLDKVSLNESG